MRREDVETLVVGAGPAGSAAAATLARAGHQVFLCDRASFPRDKPCGDLIGARALSFARRLGVSEADLDPYPSLAGVLILADGRTVDLTAGGPVGRLLLNQTDARVIPRQVFDHAMVRAASRVGAWPRQLAIRNVGPWDHQAGGRCVSAISPDGPVELLAQGVVIAGGYGCRVASDIKPESEASGPPRGIAMRGYVEGVRGLSDRIAFCLDDWVLPGYGWVFPLPDGKANVGVGTLVRAGVAEREPLRDLYERFMHHPRSPVSAYLRDSRPLGQPRSWPLDLGPRRRRLAGPGLVVAGEAAGLVGPLTGAGIAFALESGYRAGAALALTIGERRHGESALRAYARNTSRKTLPWLRAEQQAQRWLSEPAHVDALLSAAELLPGSGAMGARLLLNLG